MSRLDQALVSRGLARSRTHAARLIAEGKVSSGGEVLAKASLQVPEDAALDVTASAEDGYVSRAGHKLAGALDAFPAVDVAGKRCLDAGASTGGFTDVLLRRGAAHVDGHHVGTASWCRKSGMTPEFPCTKASTSATWRPRKSADRPL